MIHDSTLTATTILRSRAWLRHATEAELLAYLQELIDHSQRQQGEILTLVETMVEDHGAMQGEMERATMDAWLADQTPPRIPWLALGFAGLAGYLIGRRRD